MIDKKKVILVSAITVLAIGCSVLAKNEEKLMARERGFKGENMKPRFSNSQSAEMSGDSLKEKKQALKEERKAKKEEFKNLSEEEKAALKEERTSKKDKKMKKEKVSNTQNSTI